MGPGISKVGCGACVDILAVVEKSRRVDGLRLYGTAPSSWGKDCRSIEYGVLIGGYDIDEDVSRCREIKLRRDEGDVRDGMNILFPRG